MQKFILLVIILIFIGCASKKTNYERKRKESNQKKVDLQHRRQSVIDSLDHAKEVAKKKRDLEYEKEYKLFSYRAITNKNLINYLKDTEYSVDNVIVIQTVLKHGRYLPTENDLLEEARFEYLKRSERIVGLSTDRTRTKIISGSIDYDVSVIVNISQSNDQILVPNFIVKSDIYKMRDGENIYYMMDVVFPNPKINNSLSVVAGDRLIETLITYIRNEFPQQQNIDTDLIEREIKANSNNIESLTKIVKSFIKQSQVESFNLSFLIEPSDLSFLVEPSSKENDIIGNIELFLGEENLGKFEYKSLKSFVDINSFFVKINKKQNTQNGYSINLDDLAQNLTLNEFRTILNRTNTLLIMTEEQQ